MKFHSKRETVIAVSKGFDEIAAELEAQGWHKEAELLRRFPRSALDDELVKGMFVAVVSVRDIERAEKVARQLVSFAPENPFAHLAFCLVKLRQGQTLEAAKAFEQAIHFASTFPAYRSQRIHWLCLQGRLDEARKFLHETVKEFADRWEVQRAQAHLWLSGKQTRQRLNQTAELLTKLVRYRPNDAIIHALLVQAYEKLDDRKRAIEHLRLMARNLPALTFTDVDAFIAHQVAKQSLATRFSWLRPSWFVERFFLRWLPPKYFAAIATGWVAVALLLAGLRFVAPTPIYTFALLIAVMAFAYDRFASPILLWLLKSIYSNEGKK